jgi:hypothetical protein
LPRSPIAAKGIVRLSRVVAQHHDSRRRRVIKFDKPSGDDLPRRDGPRRAAALGESQPIRLSLIEPLLAMLRPKKAVEFA